MHPDLDFGGITKVSEWVQVFNFYHLLQYSKGFVTLAFIEILITLLIQAYPFESRNFIADRKGVKARLAACNKLIVQ
jgi:hypothetical protein